MTIDFVPGPSVPLDRVFDAVVTFDERTRSWTVAVPDVACAAIRGATRQEAEGHIREVLAALLDLQDSRGLRVRFHYAPAHL